ncbi:unnamed protein product [Protopolystoma xenopodis]|uniref:Uncharacterized protein n=1 Tax=Protopolystoma xenopodis TaxID=117903 RepID=A0A448WLT5_9PLAT|nr:unnamed protein product [Protopolystoma xenopodis]
MVERRVSQLLHLSCLRTADDVTLLLQVLVQECLTRFTRLSLLNLLAASRGAEAQLKLFRQYNGLELLASYMTDAEPRDWELKKQVGLGFME